MDDSSANLFNFVIGVFGFATTIASTALYCRSYLPGTQMKILDELLKETRTIFETADADGLFPSDAFRKTSLTLLTCSEESGASLRERTYNATTAVQEYLALFNGLSRKIIYLSVRVKDLRASLISTSERERRNRRAGNARHFTHSNDSRSVDTTTSQLASSDPPRIPERSSRGLNVSRGSDRRRGRSASCPSAVSDPSLKENPERLPGYNCQDIERDDALVTEINSSNSSSETTDNLSRSSTLIDTPARGILNSTLGQFYSWTTSNQSKEYSLDPHTHDYDIARLPV